MTKLSGVDGAAINCCVFPMSIMYKVVAGSRLLCMIVFCVFWSTIFTVVALNTAVQLLSQSVLMDINGFSRSWGKCACLDQSGRHVYGTNAVWVDVMIFQFIILIGIGAVVIVL